MKKYGLNELRRMYLEFFESKDHLKMNSFSLVPQNDNSLLLIIPSPKRVILEKVSTILKDDGVGVAITKRQELVPRSMAA